MAATPQEITLDIIPRNRFEIIDIRNRIAEVLNRDIERYRKATYCSLHTTAGYLEQSICSRLNHQKDNIKSYIKAFQQLFPTNADYLHDDMSQRHELTVDERQVEPKNADSHLTFIGSGLKNVVTYLNKPEQPVYFIDLDGVSEHGRRNRLTSAMYYNKEEVVYTRKIQVPVSRHPIDSVNLRDPKLAYLDKINDLFHKYEVENGRVDISLDPMERHAGLTVNEYETLLMTEDLVQVLKNPVKFMGEKGKYILQNPGVIPSRTKDYAKYDLVHIFNEVMDAFHISQSAVEKVLSKFIAFPAEKFLRMKRNVSFLVSNNGRGTTPEVVQGRYQSPILVQWKETPNLYRTVTLTITRYI